MISTIYWLNKHVVIWKKNTRKPQTGPQSLIVWRQPSEKIAERAYSQSEDRSNSVKLKREAMISTIYWLKTVYLVYRSHNGES